MFFAVLHKAFATLQQDTGTERESSVCFHVCGQNLDRVKQDDDLLESVRIYTGVTKDRFPVERRGRVVTLLLSIWEVPGSNLRLQAGYPNWSLSWLSSFFPDKLRDSALN
jgi:hypothetical protein